MNWGIIIIASLLYLVLLFALAYLAEKKAEKQKSIINSPYVYALSLAVYCTAWTYYGSVGRASKSGIDFLLIYLGPTLAAPLWWFLMRKIIRISKIQNISNIADLIATRYGKNAVLGGVVTIVSVFGIIPYISLQLKAISESFAILVAENTTILKPVYVDYAFYIAVALGIFTIYFGTRQLDLNRKNEGMVYAIAFESLFKLWAFLLVGGYITFFVFDGFSDIFTRAFAQQNLRNLLTINDTNGYKALEWFLIGLASMFAVMFLPRQFQMLVAENKQEKHLQTAIWLFPLYLLIINIFVMPIALAGKLTFGNTVGIDADTYILALPLAKQQFAIALITYLGGFAAATSMVIVASLALSLMLTNNLFIPIGLYFSITKHLKDDQQWGKWVLYTRRASILLVLSLAYLYLYFIINVPLVSIGLTSFVAVCQFVPAIVGGLYWKEATRKGALAGILVGFGLWLFTLIVPTLVGRGLFSANIMSEGLWGIAWLKPYQLFGMTDLEPVSHSLFWSLLGNSFTYIGVSAFTSQTSQERNQAELFVDVFKYSNVYDEVVVWRGIAHKKDLEDLLSRFLDKEKVQSLLADFQKEQVASVSNQEHNARLVKYAERILASTIGSTSARILVRSVVQEEEIGKEELLQMLRESQEIKKNNFELKKADKQKNEFISTVTHELRTPITSIRSLSEILYENPDLEEAQKQQFLQTVIGETERMERLINQVLDLEKFESGKQTLHLEVHTINDILKEAITIYQSVVTEKKLELKTKLFEQPVWVMVDKDRLLQVILNLLSNAVKFARHTIWIESSLLEKQLEVSVSDDGKGVPEELREAIFEKFFQAENQNIRKPKGSGLGLAICKKIIQYHQGYIGVECKEGVTRFYFRLNVYPKS